MNVEKRLPWDMKVDHYIGNILAISRHRSCEIYLHALVRNVWQVNCKFDKTMLLLVGEEKHDNVDSGLLCYNE